ncbi:MAG: metal-dependent hydrolase [Betaproteobacteria bacterium]|nr:metal-dependent hydrolase [Betaproteobacteria bacterium]
MDSVSQFALGAAVAVSLLGRRTAAWKATLWGGAVATLPDLDALIGFEDAILDMTRHRAESHGYFYLTLAAAALGWLSHRAYKAMAFSRAHLAISLRDWLLAAWLVLVTHATLDYFTVYGTQLLQPFSDYPFGLGSIFIIDPLYTLPLLIGLILAIARLGRQPVVWCHIGLAVSTLYLLWTVAGQQVVKQVALQSLPEAHSNGRLLVTPAPLNTILWRLVWVNDTYYYEGWYSFFDATKTVKWERYDRGADLIAQHADHPGVSRVAAFSQGFYRMGLDYQAGEPQVFVTDLRMGQEPFYVFHFGLGSPDAQGTLPNTVATIKRGRPDLASGLPWLKARALADTELSLVDWLVFRKEDAR